MYDSSYIIVTEQKLSLFKFTHTLTSSTAMQYFKMQSSIKRSGAESEVQYCYTRNGIRSFIREG